MPEPAMPEVPTFSEAGVRGADSMSWYAAFLPRTTPAPILNRIHSEIVRALNLPEVKESLANLGADVVGNRPADLDAIVREKVKLWTRVVKETGAKID